MTAIERTAYPRFAKFKQISNKQRNIYSTSFRDIHLAEQHTSNNLNKLNFLIMLKSFQRLGYFPKIDQVPVKIVQQISNSIGINKPIIAQYSSSRTAQSHKKLIREYLGVKIFDSQAKNMITQAGYTAFLTLNDSADVINIMIEELISKCYELPSFEILDRIVKHCRARVNNEMFKKIAENLPEALKKSYNGMFLNISGTNKTAFNDIKKLPKKATINNVHNFIAHHNWLTEIGAMHLYLKAIAKPKIKAFALWAATMDASDMRNLENNKRNALLTCLLYEAKIKAKDSLARMICKIVNSLHKKAKKHLETLKLTSLKKASRVAETLSYILGVIDKSSNKKLLEKQIKSKILEQGGTQDLSRLCDEIIAYVNQDHTYLISRFLKAKTRSAFFKVLKTLSFTSTTQDKKLIMAVKFLLKHEHTSKQELIATNLDLSFLSRQWRKLIIIGKRSAKKLLNKSQLEAGIFCALAEELRSGDICITGADKYADYRNQLLSWNECKDQVLEYCQAVKLEATPDEFIKTLKENLLLASKKLDESYPNIEELIIDEKGIPILKRKRTACKKINWLQREIVAQMPERNILDVLCSTHHYTGWANYFGPISGSEPKMKNSIEKYILTTFAYGSSMGPTQGAKHFKGCEVSPHILSWINRRHITAKALDQALTSLINAANSFELIDYWGDGKSCASDGTLCRIYEDNLLAEYHIRYGSKGGIAYYHIANNYIALFSTFIPCGVWEVVAILDAILNNKSDIKPDTIHADTQGQSLVAFGLSYLLGIKLMPRIRNWHDLNLYRPHQHIKYKNIDSLFTDKNIKWHLIEEHFNDMMQVILSIKSGKISSSHLLQRLSNYARKNKLLLAFQELGKVIRTMFLIEYISSVEFREEITANTNKVESYNNFSAWIRFNADNYIISSNDPDEQEKAVKYNCLIANAIILQNIVDISNIITMMIAQDAIIRANDLKHLSPYITSNIKRFGDYLINILSRFIPKGQKLEICHVVS